MAAKKMIAAHLIGKVTISRDYEIVIDFNLTLEQFNLGLSSATIEAAAM